MKTDNILKVLESHINGLTELQSTELELKVDRLIQERKSKIRADAANKTMSDEEILRNFTSHGFIVPKNSTIWKIDYKDGQEYDGYYGLEVGRITHSCHIDTTDFIILMIMDKNGNAKFDYYSDLWLTKAFTT